MLGRRIEANSVYRARLTRSSRRSLDPSRTNVTMEKISEILQSRNPPMTRSLAIMDLPEDCRGYNQDHARSPLWLLSLSQRSENPRRIETTKTSQGGLCLDPKPALQRLRFGNATLLDKHGDLGIARRESRPKGRLSGGMPEREGFVAYKLARPLSIPPGGSTLSARSDRCGQPQTRMLGTLFGRHYGVFPKHNRSTRT